MSTTPVATVPKVSFLKRFGQIIGKILSVVSKDAAPAADQAAKVAEVLLPQFSPEIMAADNLIDKIAKQCLVTEAVAAAAATPVAGQSKLDTVLAEIGPDIDLWVANRFPGATTVSAASKAGLVNAVVAITNELEGKTPVAASSPTTK